MKKIQAKYSFIMIKNGGLGSKVKLSCWGRERERERERKKGVWRENYSSSSSWIVGLFSLSTSAFLISDFSKVARAEEREEGRS